MITYFSVMVIVMVIGILFMQQLKDVSYNLDHSRVLFNSIYGESNALSDRDMSLISFEPSSSEG